MINIEDLDGKYPLRIDPWWTRLVDRQNELLNARLIQTRVSLSQEYLANSNVENVAAIIETQLNEKWVHHIGTIIPTERREDVNRDFIIYEKRAILLKLGELKHIVELMIKMIPEKDLNEIRNQP